MISAEVHAYQDRRPTGSVGCCFVLLYIFNSQFVLKVSMAVACKVVFQHLNSILPPVSMPVLDGLRHGEPVDGSQSFNERPRQKIVIVGLGMVAISLM